MNRLAWLRLVALWTVLGSLLIGCEKETTNGYLFSRPIVGYDPENRPPGYVGYYSSEAKLRDTVYLRTYEFYLWQDQLPSSFFTQDYKTAEGLLDALKTYAKDPIGQPYDRFSFLDRSNTVREEIQQGRSQGGFGFEVRYQSETDLYLKKVDPGSPAYTAGLRRGWQILAINGRSDLSVAAMEQDNFVFLFNAIYGQTVDLRLRKPDGGEVTVSLQSRPYALTPILRHEIFNAGGTKVGYLAFDIFVDERLISTQINAILDQFEAAGVKHLIMDLRYNGGGNVATAAYLSNLLAPPAVMVTDQSGKLMFSYKMNESFAASWGPLIFQPEYFAKTNSLALDRIYFLVTGLTASASELLINNLTPHMDVKLIGDGNTYGKPVGYFAWPIMGVDLYAVSFQTFNSLGEGDYFDGLPVDQYAGDDVTRDFGDPQEGMTAAALHHVATGSFPAGGLSTLRRDALREPIRVNTDLDRRMHRPIHGAMFDFRKISLPLPHETQRR